MRIAFRDFGPRFRLAVRRLVQRVLRRQLNAFAKSVISEAKQSGQLDSRRWHELAGIIDRRLWPEWHR